MLTILTGRVGGCPARQAVGHQGRAGRDTVAVAPGAMAAKPGSPAGRQRSLAAVGTTVSPWKLKRKKLTSYV